MLHGATNLDDFVRDPRPVKPNHQSFELLNIRFQQIASLARYLFVEDDAGSFKKLRLCMRIPVSQETAIVVCADETDFALRE